MHSLKQLKNFKIKKAASHSSISSDRGQAVYEKFKYFVPKLVNNGILKPNPNLLMGGPFAAVVVVNSLGYTLIDRPQNYSFSNDNKKTNVNDTILKNKNIVTKDLKSLENDKVPVSDYFQESNDPILVADMESRNINETKALRKSKKPNDPNSNIKIDISELVMNMCIISDPDFGSAVFDPKFHSLTKTSNSLLGGTIRPGTGPIRFPGKDHTKRNY